MKIVEEEVQSRCLGLNALSALSGVVGHIGMCCMSGPKGMGESVSLEAVCARQNASANEIQTAEIGEIEVRRTRTAIAKGSVNVTETEDVTVSENLHIENVIGNGRKRAIDIGVMSGRGIESSVGIPRCLGRRRGSLTLRQIMDHYDLILRAIAAVLMAALRIRLENDEEPRRTRFVIFNRRMFARSDTSLAA